MDRGLRGGWTTRPSRAARRALGALDLDALIVTRLPNVRYLTGFTGSNGQVVVARDGSAVFLTDGRYEEQATHEVPDLERTAYRQGYPRPLLDACRTLGAGKAGFEGRGLVYDDWAQLGEAADGLELVPTGPRSRSCGGSRTPTSSA